MKTLTAKNQKLSLEENIHAALKREFLYAEPIIDGHKYKVGSSKTGITIMWWKHASYEYAINTNEGRCYLMFNEN